MGKELYALTLYEMWAKETKAINFVNAVENHFL